MRERRAGRARPRVLFSFVFPLLFLFLWCEIIWCGFPLFFLLSLVWGVGGPTMTGSFGLRPGKTRYVKSPPPLLRQRDSK